MTGPRDHRPRKRFGQHFLHDPRILQRIVSAVSPKKGDHLVEIGPGLGALTRPLLQHTGRLDAVELDRDVIPILEESCGELGELRIHNADALAFDFCTLAHPGEQLRLVGNLPYNISTPLLFHLLEQVECIADMHFMLQKEVVERIVAPPNSEHYGRLSVMMQYRCQAVHLFNVPPGAFRPPPKVDSSIVRLIPHRTPPVAVGDPHRLEQLVAQAFSKRRKTLRNALKGWVNAEAMAAAGIDATRRPETLSLAEFAALANTNPQNSEALDDI